MATIIDHATGTVYSPGGAAQVAHNWWALVLRGVLAVLLGVAAFALPQVTLYGIVFAFGAYALIDGAFNVVAGIRTRKETKRWWTLLLSGLLGIGAGAAAFALPTVSAVALTYLIGAWAVVTGILEIAAAIRLRKEIKGEWLLGLSGVASLLIGLAMIANPGVGALAWVWLFGAYTLLAGAFLIGAGLRLRKLNERLGTATDGELQTLDGARADGEPKVDPIRDATGLPSAG